MSTTGIAGKPISIIMGSAFSIRFRASLLPSVSMHVTAPYVTAVQYTDPTSTPPATNGLIRLSRLSIMSRKLTNASLLGYTIIYVKLHWGHATSTELLPCCFSSIHRCRHVLWTHLAVPRHLHGLTH